MKENPPMMITPKDRLYISDILNMVHVYAKKCCSYESFCKDTDVSKQIHEFYLTLCDQYDDLLKLLKEGKK